MSEKLGLLATFPSLTLTTTRQETLTLPDDLNTDYAVVLFYRGHW